MSGQALEEGARRLAGMTPALQGIDPAYFKLGKTKIPICNSRLYKSAQVVKLVDTHDSGSCA